jgi:hypothetical protein
MKNWFKLLIAHLVGTERTGAAQRTDWRGRRVNELTGRANTPVGLLDGDRYATLHPPSFAEAPGAVPGITPIKESRVVSARQTRKPTPDPHSA